jgi:hypothetical protein
MKLVFLIYIFRISVVIERTLTSLLLGMGSKLDFHSDDVLEKDAEEICERNEAE